MRDTTVRQSRIPHSWESLSEDCNLHPDTLEGLICEHGTSQGAMFFIQFLNGDTYVQIGQQYGVTAYAVQAQVKKTYQAVRRSAVCR